jgi:hypothetical protein
MFFAVTSSAMRDRIANIEVMWLLIALLFLAWLLGMVLVPFTGLIHMLLVVAFILLVLRLVRGERII